MNRVKREGQPTCFWRKSNPWLLPFASQSCLSPSVTARVVLSDCQTRVVGQEGGSRLTLGPVPTPLASWYAPTFPSSEGQRTVQSSFPFNPFSRLEGHILRGVTQKVIFLWINESSLKLFIINQGLIFVYNKGQCLYSTSRRCVCVTVGCVKQEGGPRLGTPFSFTFLKVEVEETVSRTLFTRLFYKKDDLI